MEIVVHSKKSVSTKVSQETTISTGIPNLGVWFKKWSDWTSGVGQKNPTPNVVRNPIPSKNVRLRNPDLTATKNRKD